MKLLAIEMSRLTALFQTTRSAGQIYLPLASARLSGRYSFSSAPKSISELTGDRLEFKHGQFNDNAIESLEVYNDGIIISSSSDTDFIDEFFSDFCEWISDNLGLSMIKTHSINRIYESSFSFETKKDILKPLEAYSEIAKLVESDLKETTGLEVNYEPSGWVFTSDQTKNPYLKPSIFRIERRAGIEFGLNQFSSAAPLKTKQHINIIEKLESVF